MGGWDDVRYVIGWVGGWVNVSVFFLQQQATRPNFVYTRSSFFLAAAINPLEREG